MEIQEIVSRLKKRDKEALSSLFDKYGASLNGIITRILPSEKLAEEVLQQTFLIIWNKIMEYDESKSTLFTWMSQIARSNAIEAKCMNTSQNLSKTEPSETENKEGLTAKIIKLDPKNIEENLEAKHKMIIDCIYLKGYSQSQTAAALEIPEDAVKVRLRDALIELSKILKYEKDKFFGAFLFIIIIIAYLCL